MQYKWEKEADNSDTDADNARAMQQWNSRSFSWSETSNGSTRIQITLPPELAQVILKSVEHSLNTESTDNLSQCRADAAVRMAEASLQAAGKHISSADRYQVVVSVDAATLNNTAASLEKRPIISGANPIATETAKRIACDCSITKNTLLNGELLDIGRKSRIWTTAQERAIKNRDRHCQFPGCTEARYLQIHHIEHWADGGSTSIENGVCLCTGCHTKVHEGGYTLQRVDNNPQLINEQFKDQQHKDDLTMFDFEKSLRANRDSFDTIRQLSPTRYRFRVIGPKGVYPFNSARAECSEANPPAYRFTPFSPRNNAAPAPHHLPDPCCLQC